MEMIQAKKVTVLRNGEKVDISIPEEFIFALDREAKSDTATINFMAYRFPTHHSGDARRRRGQRRH